MNSRTQPFSGWRLRVFYRLTYTTPTSSVVHTASFLIGFLIFEEIVGEIEDETDQDDEQQALETMDDRHWESDGLVALSDAQKQLGLTVPADLVANTLSGLFTVSTSHPRSHLNPEFQDARISFQIEM